MDDNPSAQDAVAVAIPEAARRKRRFKREDHHGIAGGVGMMREAHCIDCGRMVLALDEGRCGRCSVKAEYRRRAAAGKLTRADLSEKAYLKYRAEKRLASRP